MARIIVAGVLVLLGIVLSVGAFQDYEEGSCGAGECTFASRLDDPVFLVIGILAVIAGVLIFLNRMPFLRKRELPPPASKNYGIALFALQAASDTSYMVDSGGVDWKTLLGGVVVVAAIVGVVWFKRNRGKGAEERR